MEKQELLRRVGSMQQAASLRPVLFQEGRAGWLRAYELKNGPMSMTILADKCLDVAELSFRGVNMNFLSKPGLQGRNHYDTNGQEALRSIMGGMFFTAGLENICVPCTVEGKDYPMHGRIRTTPAEHCSSSARWENGEYRLCVTGEMREAELFGENLLLRRSISTVYGSHSFILRDELENEGFREEPVLLLYHINLGYPFLDENLRLILPTTEVKARDEVSRGHEKDWFRMDPPVDSEPEYVFLHTLAADESGNTEVLAVNEPLGLGLKLEFNKKNFPYFMEWKSTASGDYVIGLEPSNASVYGRLYHEKNGTVPTLPPQKRTAHEIRFTLLDGAEEIRAAVSGCKCKFGQISPNL